MVVLSMASELVGELFIFKQWKKSGKTGIGRGKISLLVKHAPKGNT